MKKNGFTVVELLVSLSLTMVVVIVMFEIIILLKDLFQTSNVKTEILNKKSIIVDKMYTDINNRNVSRIEQCGDYCLNFTMNDSTEKKFEVNKDENIITYDDYTFKLEKIYTIGNIYFSNDVLNYTSNEKNNGIFVLKVPIYSKLTNKENLGIDMVATYNTNSTAIGALYIKDTIQDNCNGSFCKDNMYNVGDEIKLADYKWHVIKNNESSITLLLDGNEISNRSHIENGVAPYQWSTSNINKYLNGNFYESLLDKGVDEDEILTEDKTICDDKTGSGGNPGALNIEGLDCKSEYVTSKIRLLTQNEFEEVKSYFTEKGLDYTFLYSETVGKWALINGDSSSNKILQVDSTGGISKDSSTVLLNVRPVITLRKK